VRVWLTSTRWVLESRLRTSVDSAVVDTSLPVTLSECVDELVSRRETVNAWLMNVSSRVVVLSPVSWSE
jgi:hypothetical protein